MPHLKQLYERNKLDHSLDSYIPSVSVLQTQQSQLLAMDTGKSGKDGAIYSYVSSPPVAKQPLSIQYYVILHAPTH